jgi:hypothetical protein
VIHRIAASALPGTFLGLDWAMQDLPNRVDSITKSAGDAYVLMLMMQNIFSLTFKDNHQN